MKNLLYMSLHNYICFTLNYNLIETFSEYIKKIFNLERLKRNFNIRLRIIVNRRSEVVFNKGYNIANNI